MKLNTPLTRHFASEGPTNEPFHNKAMKRHITLSLILFLGVYLLSNAHSSSEPIKNAADQWPMAGGPNGTWTTTTHQSLPTSWSVSNDQNIIWKTTLPEGGQSGIAVWGDRLFLSINQPLPEGTPLAETIGTDIVAYCLNSRTGEILWSQPIPSVKPMPYSGLFSDNSSPTPITDGRHVWFINAGGRMTCFEMEGKQAWSRQFEARTRHNAKQCEPILLGNQLLYVAMLDPHDPLRREMKAEPGKRNTAPELWPWTFLRSFNAKTGESRWSESTGTSVHNTPRIGYIGRDAFVFHGRGGGHQPPEMPFGFSMTHASGKKAGETLWNYHSKNPATYTVSHFDEKHAYVIEEGFLTKLSASTGKVLNRIPLFDRATLHLWDPIANKYQTHRNAPFSKAIGKYKPEPTNQTSILVGKYYLFLSHEGHCIGRVDTEIGNLEYLQVPRQVVRKPNAPDQILWNEHIPSDGTNSRGLPIANDKRSKGDGWGHVTCGSPIAVNEFVYFQTMIGMTYVVNSQTEEFDPSALVSINDLGPAGETWSLSSPSYAQGKIFHRGLKQVVCIGEMDP